MGAFEHVLADAKRFYKENPSFAEFSDRYFSLRSPFMPQTREGRAEYVASPEYREIQRMAFELEERQMAAEERKGRDSKRFVFRAPASVMAALEAEAAREKTSLNQLLLAKACIPLRVYRFILARFPDLLYDESMAPPER